MVDHQRIYAERAEDYDRLVAVEDCDGRLLPAIRDLVSLEGASALEVGVGTGRVTRLLVAAGARVVGCEPAEAMLAVAKKNLAGLTAGAVELSCCRAQDFEIPAGAFHLAIAGWVFGHFVTWFALGWREEIGAALDRMLAGLRPGGALVIIETLGTGATVPRPPNDALAGYYDWLERERGFARVELRTDYLFADVEEAARVTGGFFGDVFAQLVLRERWVRVPECTGLWWRRP